MSDMTTIARPYAKAVFEYAHAAHELAAWSVVLNCLSHAVLNKDANMFIDNPEATIEQQSQLLLALFAHAGENKQLPAIQNLVAMLAENRRLLLLPDIYTQFEALRAEQEKTLTVDVQSFSTLTDAQQKELTHSLSLRLQRQITLAICIDKSLLGGAIIRAGDLVIDGSVRGKLNKLSTNLAA